jgi:hypothetical protein
LATADKAEIAEDSPVDDYAWTIGWPWRRFMLRTGWKLVCFNERS